MTKETFLKIVEILQRTESNIDVLNKMGIDLIDSHFSNDIYFLSNHIIKQEYRDTGLDWFLWWVYELPDLKKRMNSKETYAKDPNGDPIILDNAEQLYDFLEKELKNDKH
jgi:hypothetical protein